MKNVSNVLRKYWWVVLIIFLFLLGLLSDQTKELNAQKDPYEIMHVVFEGSPDASSVKKMMEPVIIRYNMPQNDDTRLKIANMLLGLRKQSAVGVTEMDLLKHIYQHGYDKVTLAQQAGISATILESTK